LILEESVRSLTSADDLEVHAGLRSRRLVADAQRAVQASIQFPPGHYVTWSGQNEYLERATAQLKIVIPVTLLIIFLLLYLNFRSRSSAGFG
jgi:copper/silver efflux system protein